MELAEQAAELLLLSKTREAITTKPNSELTGTKQLPDDIMESFMEAKFDQMTTSVIPQNSYVFMFIFSLGPVN